MTARERDREREIYIMQTMKGEFYVLLVDAYVFIVYLFQLF